VISTDEKCHLQALRRRHPGLGPAPRRTGSVEFEYRRGDFKDLGELAERILAFQDRYNTTPEPFDWKYIRTGLIEYLRRLAKHEDLTDHRKAG
jgi:hypothetical protein